MKLLAIGLWLVLVGCSSTSVVESPKTAFVPETGNPVKPEMLWTSRTLTRPFDYLGRIRVRSWSYQGALKRIQEGAQKLRADAVTDLHYHPVGFMSEMQAFAIKFKD